MFLITLIIASVFYNAKAQTYQIGDKVANFKLKNVTGEWVSLIDYKNAKGVIIIFTCNHCPYAVKYEDRIIELDMKYKDRGYPVVAINPNDPVVVPDDSYEKMQQRAEEKEFPFPYLFDEKQKIFPRFGATRTPQVFLLQNVNNEFFLRYIGAIDDNFKSPEEVEDKFVENAISALEKGQLPDPDITKAIGCTIKVQKKESEKSGNKGKGNEKGKKKN